MSAIIEFTKEYGFPSQFHLCYSENTILDFQGSLKQEISQLLFSYGYSVLRIFYHILEGSFLHINSKRSVFIFFRTGV